MFQLLLASVTTVRQETLDGGSPAVEDLTKSVSHFRIRLGHFCLALTVFHPARSDYIFTPQMSRVQWYLVSTALNLSVVPSVLAETTVAFTDIPLCS